MYELCNDTLQRKLKHNREVADKRFEAQMAAKRARTDADNSSSSSSSAEPVAAAVSGDSAAAMDVVGDGSGEKGEHVFSGATTSASSASGAAETIPLGE